MWPFDDFDAVGRGKRRGHIHRRHLQVSLARGALRRSPRELILHPKFRGALAARELPPILLDPPPEGVRDRRPLGERTLAVSTALLRGRDGSVSGRILLVEDVTREVTEEQERIRREKLASIGILSAGVAHEINTPLAGIASYVQMLLDTTPLGDPRRGLLDKSRPIQQRESRVAH